MHNTGVRTILPKSSKSSAQDHWNIYRPSAMYQPPIEMPSVHLNHFAMVQFKNNLSNGLACSTSSTRATTWILSRVTWTFGRVIELLWVIDKDAPLNGTWNRAYQILKCLLWNINVMLCWLGVEKDHDTFVEWAISSKWGGDSSFSNKWISSQLRRWLITNWYPDFSDMLWRVWVSGIRLLIDLSQVQLD